MAITTFDDLILRASSEKVFLCEIEPSQLLTDWTVYAGSIYYIDISKNDVQTVTQDGTALTEVTALTDVGAGDWYYVNGRIYVQVTSGSIYQRTMVANYKLYFGSKAKVFNSKFYEPLIAAIPSIRQKKIDLFWGISIISDGQIGFYNSSAFFDNIYEQYAWSNKPLTVLLGGEDLPYSEYKPMFTGRILDKHLSTSLFDVSFVDKKDDLEESLPEGTFSVAAYPNIETENVGQPIPLVYGTVRRMPIPCVTGALGSATSLHTFKIADTSSYGIQSISQVYVDGVAVAHQSADISAATFKLATATFTVGQNVAADLNGYQSGTVLLQNPVEITKKLLALQGFPYTSTYFDTTEVDAAVVEGEDFPIGLVVVEFRPGIDILGDVMKSCLGTLITNNEGKFAIGIWNTNIPADLTEVTPDEIISGSLKAKAKYDEIRKTVRIGWSKNWNADTYAYKQVTTSDTEYVYGITRTRTIPTLLSTDAGSETYLDRVGLMHRKATIELVFSTKIQLAQKNIGDRLSVTFKRRSADNNIEWLDSKVVEIQQINKRYKKGITQIIADDLKGIGDSIGHWTSDTPTFPDSVGGGDGSTWDSEWATARKAYAKSHWGYWVDDDGFADPTDPDSFQISRWW